MKWRVSKANSIHKQIEKKTEINLPLELRWIYFIIIQGLDGDTYFWKKKL